MRSLDLLFLILIATAGCHDKKVPKVDNSLEARFPIPENSARKDGKSADADINTPNRGGPTSRPGQNASTNAEFGGHPSNAVLYTTNTGAYLKQTYPGPKDAPAR